MMATETDELAEGGTLAEAVDALRREPRETEDDARAIEDYNANGRSIEDLAEDEEEPKPRPPMQIPLPGYFEEISSSFGGAPPTSSEMRLLGGLMPLEGQFSKGDEVLLLVRARVTHVEGADVTDDWGAVTRTIRRHKARMIEVRRSE